MVAKEYTKLATVRRIVYVRMGDLKILTHYFLMPKVEYIRMVYNNTLSGINPSLWAPHFDLPTARSTLQAVERGTFMADRNIGETVINLMFSEKCRSFCGVDITNLWTEE